MAASYISFRLRRTRYHGRLIDTEMRSGICRSGSNCRSLVADAAKHQPAGSQDSSEPVENNRPGDPNRPEELSGVSEPVDLDYSDGAHRTENSNDPVDEAGDDTLGSEQLGVVWTQGTETFTAVLTDGSMVVNGAGAVTTISAGHEGMLKYQAMSVPFEGDSIKVNGAVRGLSPLEEVAGGEEANKQAAAGFTEAGQVLTALVQGG